jgi:hypothetical protein
MKNTDEDIAIKLHAELKRAARENPNKYSFNGDLTLMMDLIDIVRTMDSRRENSKLDRIRSVMDIAQISHIGKYGAQSTLNSIEKILEEI